MIQDIRVKRYISDEGRELNFITTSGHYITFRTEEILPNLKEIPAMKPFIPKMFRVRSTNTSETIPMPTVIVLRMPKHLWKMRRDDENSTIVFMFPEFANPFFVFDFQKLCTYIKSLEQK